MHKHIILFFSALLFLFACKSDKVPEGIINEDEMVRLLVDIHIIDGSLSNQPGADSLYKYGTGRYQYLFKQYRIDTATFKKSVKYYTTQPDQFVEMYDKVAARLKIKADSLTKIQQKLTAIAQKKQDKINKELAKKTTEKEKLKQDSIKLKKDSTKKRLLKRDSIKKAIKARLLERRNKLKTTTNKNALPPK